MIEIRNKQILIDEKPQIIMCGQIHYFRLERKDWQDRIDKLKAAGCNAVAAYVPWLCHEPIEGQIDLEGKTLPQLDLVGFIDLCKENELYFIVRPGPFIMAEMKNQGLPYWLYQKHPEIIPVSWDGKPVTTDTVDYLAPHFLQETRKWYASIMSVIAPRLQTKGGNIIGVQLDNEIGMLSWVSNSPDLTDHVLADFAGWLKETYDVEAIKARYPFDPDDMEARRTGIRSPKEEYAAELMRDLGYYMRNRFARYVSTLRSYAEEFGVSEVPFLVNIHGSHAGRALTFPIGISQLYESYTQAPGYISGSDIYIGDLTMSTFQDLYLINGFMDAVHNSDHPLTSLEFSCGDGNYGNTYSGRRDPSADDLKTRMCMAQGNRILNYYSFAGGTNYRLEPKPNDGNDRIAGNGEYQGFAAPVGPTGELNYTYPRMARAIKTMMAVSDKLAVMEEEKDGVAFAFIPDYYMTEYRYPKSEKMNEIVKNLEKNRAAGAWEIMARAMLLSGYRFGSVDVQNKPIDAKKTPVLALPSASYMQPAIQQKLVDFLCAGGGILLYGEVPSFDMEGKPCTILADALSVTPKRILRSADHKYLSVYADGWAKPRPEVRTGFAQTFELAGPEAILRIYGTDEVCGFDAKVGDGRAIAIAAAYSCDLPLFKTALEKLGAKATLTHDHPDHGIFMTSTAAKGERFIHLLNLDGFDKEMHLYENGRGLLDGRKMVLQSRDGVMLPLNVSVGDVKIVYSTAEIVNVTESAIGFRLTQSEDVIAFETTREIVPSNHYVIRKEGKTTFVVSRKHAKVDDDLTVTFYDANQLVN